MPTSQDIRQTLFLQDPEFRKLAEEHSRCECQLESLLSQPYLNSDDLLQESVLKKLKLQLKDQMQTMVARRQHRVAHP